jgi:hypothetical protein
VEFQGTAVPLDDEGQDRVCAILDVTPVEVWAVLTVETRGFGFLADRRPVILFERHIFHRLTGGTFDLGHAGISDSKPGGYVGGAGEYARLRTAMDLDRCAALESTSWGLGQVMGFNHEVAGFTTVDEMVAALVRNESSHLFAMARFILGTGLDGPLRRNEWETFAEGYNGPDFRKNKYDTRLAAAHAKSAILLPDLRLRAAQSALVYVGFDPGPIDGVPGRRTRSALLAFQEEHGLPQTSELDKETEATLLAIAFPGEII